MTIDKQTPETGEVCTCPRTDGYRIKRRTCLVHAEQDAAHWAEHDRRKFGTDSPHEPTDEFVAQAFAEGARSLWPDSRDPGWHVTFRKWLATRDARIASAALDDVDQRLAARIGEGRDDPETSREGSYFSGFLDGLESGRSEVRWKRPDVVTPPGVRD